MKKKLSDEEMEKHSFLSVGEISERSGVPVSALHFYETKGLIIAFRNKQNQRRYPKGMLRILSLIKVAQTLGFSLEDISQMLKVLPEKNKPTEKDWENLSKHWKILLNEKIRTIEKLRDQLDKCIGCGCLSLKDCPLRNKDDRLAKKGPGAHLI